MNLDKFIRDIPDFPKKGVVFKDITPLLGSKEAFAKAISQLITIIGDQKIDKVVGIEARGFFFGPIIALKLNAGFVPVRKPNKLPHKTISENYDLEYGSDSLEIHEDAIQVGETILLHDDILATGGTAAAVIKLIERSGGKVVQCNFLGEIEFLEGRKQLGTHKVTSLFKF